MPAVWTEAKEKPEVTRDGNWRGGKVQHVDLPPYGLCGPKATLHSDSCGTSRLVTSLKGERRTERGGLGGRGEGGGGSEEVSGSCTSLSVLQPVSAPMQHGIFYAATKRETNFSPPRTFRAAPVRAACRSLAAARGGAGGDGGRIGWQGPNTNKRELQPSDSGRQPVVDPGRQCRLETPPLRVSTTSRTDSQHRPCRQHTCTDHFVFACTGWWGGGGGGVCIREVCL